MDLSFLEQDLNETEPQDVGTLTSPYTDLNTSEEKVILAYHCLQRTLKLKSRPLSLQNAYFLGKALNEEVDVYERHRLKRRLTKHYLVMSENAYDLFEVNPFQMLRVQYLTVQDIKKMKRSQILYLRKVLQG